MFVVTNQDITIYDARLGVSCFLKSGTEVYIDVEENIAIWDGLHFDISPDEYNVLN